MRAHHLVIVGIVLIILLISFINFQDETFSKIKTKFNERDADEIEETIIEPIIEEAKTPNISQVTIAAAGDILMHDGPIKSGFDEKTGVYDYSEFFHVIKDEIISCDIGMTVLEAALAGKEERFTGYPCFNSPDEIADALKDAGFNIIITSNNHSLDRRAKGALRTIDVLKDKGLIPLGTYATEEDSKEILIVEKNDIKLAFLSYTYGTNGIPLPKDMPFLVSLIDEDKILEDINRAKDISDAVIVYLHFGNEYQRTPSKAQRDLAHLLLKNGANIIVGSHPHVIQPSEKYEQQNLDGEIEKKYIAYSLGNFLSAQRFPYTEEGLILKFTFEKNHDEDKTRLKEVHEIDTWVDKFIRDGKMRYVVRYGKKPV